MAFVPVHCYSLVACSILQRIILSDNTQVSGSIPTSYSALASVGLVSLDVTATSVCGSIPSSKFRINGNCLKLLLDPEGVACC